MTKPAPKPKRPTPQELRQRHELEKRAAMAKSTEETKRELREKGSKILFYVLAYLVVSAMLIQDAKNHPGTAREIRDWDFFVRGSAALFATLMVRYGMKWNGRSGL